MQQPQTAPPNILLFMVDQLTARVLSAYGGQVCKTPNIDRLAARGAVFETAYCPYPLCAPSRFAMMSGRRASAIGAWDNGAEFPASVPTFAHYLRGLGYYTCISGKMHFVGPDQMHGFEERLTTEIYPSDFSWTPAPAEVAAQDRFGAGVSTVETVLDAGPMARTMQIDYDEDVVHRAEREIYARARGEDRRPFLLTVSLTQPHDPYVTTQEWWDLYEGAEIDPPRVPPIPLAARDPHSAMLHHHYGQDRVEIDAAATLAARRAYYGMTAHIDALFGRLVAALDACGMGEDTVVVFASDHGDMMGERGMWFKKTLFDPAIHVPLVMAGPGITHGRVDVPVSLLDLLPTFVDLAGAPEGTLCTPCDGASLLPLLNGGRDHPPVMVEHLDGGTDAPRVMLRDGALKLVLSEAYPPMLFDLGNDPEELVNLADDPAWADDLARLTAQASAIWDLPGLAEEKRLNQTARTVVNRALQKGKVLPWDYVPGRLGQDAYYVRSGDVFPEVERRRYLPLAGRKP
ncbi:choline-sulfatase [Oceanibium sediminis]|uniref:choline-sulfatase n=1 Tax=Oceanibium sediminis TaxID=2026339 RepID=UPI0013008134|nr:choline-sulfatase [Oceanibium sediminis]